MLRYRLSRWRSWCLSQMRMAADIHGHIASWRGWEGDLAGRMLGGFDGTIRGECGSSDYGSFS